MRQTFKLTTPVLFLVFNRPETTKLVFEEIKKAKPSQLFVAADGPRNDEEKKKTDEVKKIVSKIDWPCKVKTLFREKNLGCKYAVSGAIDWFFENVEQGIILEDDCLPSQSFFRFCQEMLIKYKDDERIMQVGGTNVEITSDYPESYFFSDRLSPWGWATWRRAWKLYDRELESYEKLKLEGRISQLEDPIFRGLIGKRTYRLLRQGKINTWDFQWYTSCMLNRGVGIIPKVNLITNLGFSNGTHTTNINNKSLKRKEIEFPLKENKIINKNQDYKKKFNKFFRKGWMLRRIQGVVTKIYKG